MDSAQHQPPEGVRAPDLEKLSQTTGPFLSVYLTTEAEIENASQRSEQHWRALRSQLEEDGVPDGLLQAVGELVTDAHQQGPCLAVMATDAGVLHVDHGPRVPTRDIGTWGPLPRLSPIIEWRQTSPAHVVILADRRGADISAFSQIPDLHIQTDSGDAPERKVGPGGWSQQRFQQRAENAWEQNAEEIAAQVGRVVDATNAQLIVIAGDVRTLAILREELPETLRSLVREIEGGRTLDGSGDAIAGEVARLVGVVAASESAAVLQRFEEERGQGDLAAEGSAAVLETLSMAQVEQLLVHDDLDDERTAWFGPEPVHVAATREELEALGVDEPLEGRLVDVAIRAALGTGASVRIIPHEAGLSSDLGALLRF